MSRYSLRPLPNRTDLFEVAVGWDAGLATFFVAMFGTPDAASELVVRLWRGTKPCAIVDVREVIWIAACYAEIPDNLAHQLELDRLANPPNQNWAISWLESIWLCRPERGT